MKFRTELGLACLLLFSAIWFHHPVEYDNTSSRYFLLSAVVDHGCLDIEPYRQLQTVDIAVAGGRVYSSKAIGAPLAAVPFYWLMQKLRLFGPDAPLAAPVLYACRVLTTSLPHAVLGAVMFRLLVGLGATAAGAFFAVLAYALGTIAWIHASLFSGHQMAAAFSFISFAAVWHAARRPGGLGRWFGAGLAAGLAGLCDYTAIFTAGVLAVYALFKKKSPAQWLAFLAGGLLMAGILFAYNTACFGGPFSFSYANQEFGEFAEGSRRGLLGIAWPSPRVLLSLMLSPARGVFFIMPVLLLALAGGWAKRTDRAARPEWLTALAVVTGYFLINAGFYGWHGGWAYGPRYLVPMLPFLAMGMAFGYDRLWGWLLLLVSFGQVAFVQSTMPHTPDNIVNPLVECVYPLLRAGYRADLIGLATGISPLLSLAFFLVIVAAIAWYSHPGGAGAPPTRSHARMVYAVAVIGIIAGLAFTRSADVAAVRAGNAQLAEVMGLSLPEARPGPIELPPGLVLALLALWLVPLHCYLIYPLLCRGWSQRASQWPALVEEKLPPAVLICVYHDEEKHLPAKLANCRALDYPAGRLRLLFVSDASTDGSDAMVRADGRAELLRLDGRGGKSAGLNAACAHLADAEAGTLIVLTDANTELKPDAVRRLAEALADPGVASACGELTVLGAAGEAWYWREEQILKRGEGRLGCLIGANGALHALRLCDWEPLPAGLLMEDLLIPLRLLKRGRAVYVSAARAREESGGSGTEFRRKVRIAAANYAMLPLLLRLSLPARVRFCLWSHKIMRWLFAPLLLPLLLLSAAVLLRLAGWMGSPLLLVLPAALVVWCGLLLLPMVTDLRLLWHGLLMHAAFTVGLLRALAGGKVPHWEHDRV